MNKIIFRIENALSTWSGDEQQKFAYFNKAKELNNECGCSWGGLFLVAAMIVFAAYLLLTPQLEPLRTLMFGSLFIFGTAILGKLLGLGVARVRLFLLYQTVLNRKD